MAANKQLIGKTIGDFTVVAREARPGKYSYYRAQSADGREFVLRSDKLSLLETARRKDFGAAHIRHGMSGHPEYDLWAGMIARCTVPKNVGYKYYGARGISVCERWLNFKDFIADMGPRPSSHHSIDRIDNDGNYEPGNCRWATAKEQYANRRERA